MAHFFIGIRTRGGISGKRLESVESQGIEWEKLCDLKHSYLAAFQNEMDKALDTICTNRNYGINRDSIIGRHSIGTLPTMKTPAVTHQLSQKKHENPIVGVQENKECCSKETIPSLPNNPLKQIDNIQNSELNKTVDLPTKSTSGLVQQDRPLSVLSTSTEQALPLSRNTCTSARKSTYLVEDKPPESSEKDNVQISVEKLSKTVSTRASVKRATYLTENEGMENQPEGVRRSTRVRTTRSKQLDLPTPKITRSTTKQKGTYVDGYVSDIDTKESVKPVGKTKGERKTKNRRMKNVDDGEINCSYVEEKVKEGNSRRRKRKSSSDLQTPPKRFTPDRSTELDQPMVQVTNNTCETLHENTETFPEDPLDFVSESDLENQSSKCVLQLERAETTRKFQPLTVEKDKTDSQTQSEDSSPEQKPIDSIDTTSSDGQSRFQSQSDGSEREGVIDEQSHSKKKRATLEMWNELQAVMKKERQLAKIAKKPDKEKEMIREKEREMKKHEKKKRIADNQVGVQSKETEEKKKIGGEKNRIQHKQEESKEEMVPSLSSNSLKQNDNVQKNELNKTIDLPTKSTSGLVQQDRPLSVLSTSTNLTEQVSENTCTSGRKATYLVEDKPPESSQKDSTQISVEEVCKSTVKRATYLTENEGMENQPEGVRRSTRVRTTRSKQLDLPTPRITRSTKQKGTYVDGYVSDTDTKESVKPVGKTKGERKTKNRRMKNVDDGEIERKVKEDNSRRRKRKSSSEFQSPVKRSTPPDHSNEFHQSPIQVPNNTCETLHENTETFPEEPLDMVSESSQENQSNKCVLQLQRVETTEKSRPLTIEDNKTGSQIQSEDSSSEQKPIDSFDTTYSVGPSSDFQSLVKRSTLPDNNAELDQPTAGVSNNTCETLHENTESFPEEPLNLVSKSSLENKCVLQLQRVKTTKMSRSLTLETDSQTQSEDSSSEQKPIDSMDTTYSVEIAKHSRPLTLRDNKSDSQTQSEDSSPEWKPIDSMDTTYCVGPSSVFQSPVKKCTHPYHGTEFHQSPIQVPNNTCETLHENTVTFLEEPLDMVSESSLDNQSNKCVLQLQRVETTKKSQSLTLEDHKTDSQTQSEDSSPEQKPIDSMDTTSSDGQSLFQSQSDGSEREGVIDEQSHSKKKKRALEMWNELQAAVKNRPPTSVDAVKSFLPSRNSPIKVAENEKIKKERLLAKIAEKSEKEKARKKELEMIRERERLEKIKKREERKKRIADNQVAIQQKEAEKKKKIEGEKNRVQHKQEELNRLKVKEKEEKILKKKERFEAAEVRRKEKEIIKMQKLKEIEDERKLLDRLHRKRMELEEEERLKKKQEKQDLEKERQRKVGGPTKSTYIPDVHKPPSKYKADDTYEMQEKDDLEKESQQKMGGATMSTDVHNPASKYKTNDTYVLQEKEDLEKEKQQKMGGATKSTYTPDVHKIASKYKDIISYEITPVNKNPLATADNYDINDLDSSQSSDDEDCPKKAVPMWANPTYLSHHMQQQESYLNHNKISVENIFPPDELLQSPNLMKIFRHPKRRFFKRTSSAHWTSPILKRSRHSPVSD